ncbi:hypothetical protein HMPREF0569_2133 [Micrococcus luteus SK58]|nr:hypothetical protein HMPREF0569_2133 [Micrococcus luteus SK58]
MSAGGGRPHIVGRADHDNARSLTGPWAGPVRRTRARVLLPASGHSAYAQAMHPRRSRVAARRWRPGGSGLRPVGPEKDTSGSGTYCHHHGDNRKPEGIHAFDGVAGQGTC